VTATLSLLALWVLFSTPTQSKDRPITVEVRQDVEVTHNTKPYESRGKLYLTDLNTKEFRLKKGQRFQMIQITGEGSCRIRFEGNEYGLTSCPWLDGFRDHQTDVFVIVKNE
jgi:hypothetical protein